MPDRPLVLHSMVPWSGVFERTSLPLVALPASIFRQPRLALVVPLSRILGETRFPFVVPLGSVLTALEGIPRLSYH